MVFSGGEVDLTQIKTDETEIHLEVSSIFSGIQITVPKDWKVKSTANVFIGNVDTSGAQAGDGSVTLHLHGEAVFGEIEVRK
jgi:predicted membrane protein